MRCNLYFDSHSHSLHFVYRLPFVGAYDILCIKLAYCGYQSNEQSASLIPKIGSRDHGITSFSVPDHRIKNSILGLQSLLIYSFAAVFVVAAGCKVSR